MYIVTHTIHTNNIINNKEMSFKSIGEQEEFWICLYDVIVDDEREGTKQKKSALNGF